MELSKPTHVEARTGYRIYLEYDDGVSGEIDLSHWADKPIFKPWRDRASFESVTIASYRAIPRLPNTN